jgi:hypothetical protein
MRGLGMMMAMAMAFAGPSMPIYADPGKAYAKREPRRHGKLKQEKSLEQRMNDFSLQIVKHNEDKGSEFKNWKTYDVKGVKIISSNLKNAVKTFTRVMKENDLEETDF